MQFVWLDPDAVLANKICTSIITLLTLLFTNPAHHSSATTIVRTSAALAALAARGARIWDPGRWHRDQSSQFTGPGEKYLTSLD